MLGVASYKVNGPCAHLSSFELIDDANLSMQPADIAPSLPLLDPFRRLERVKIAEVSIGNIVLTIFANHCWQQFTACAVLN